MPDSQPDTLLPPGQPQGPTTALDPTTPPAVPAQSGLQTGTLEDSGQSNDFGGTVETGDDPQPDTTGDSASQPNDAPPASPGFLQKGGALSRAVAPIEAVSHAVETLDDDVRAGASEAIYQTGDFLVNSHPTATPFSRPIATPPVHGIWAYPCSA
jgi:hypothetical protein